MHDTMVCSHWTWQHRAGILEKRKTSEVSLQLRTSCRDSFQVAVQGRESHRAQRCRGSAGNLGRQRLGRLRRSECGKEERRAKNRGGPREEGDPERGLQACAHGCLSCSAGNWWAHVGGNHLQLVKRPQKGTSRAKAPELMGARNRVCPYQPECKAW